MQSSFFGVVLRGGRSSRMGRDKGKLLLGGRDLLTIQAEKLRDLGAAEVLLSGAGDALPGTRAVPDLLPDRGPLGGLHACLSAVGEGCCLVLPVDMPLLPEAALEALVRRHLSSGGEVTVLSVEGRLQPLAGVYEAALAPRIEALIREGGRPVRALLDQVQVNAVAYEGPEEGLLNCNTPEEFERLKERFGDRGGK